MNRKKKVAPTHLLCKVSVAVVRKLADSKTEILSQMLFGEVATILSIKNKHWMRIQCEWDGQIGWVDPKQFIKLSEDEYNQCLSNRAVAFEVFQPITFGDLSFPILIGSTLPRYDGMTFKMYKEKCVYSGQVISPEQIEISPELVLKVAKKYLHAPELVGGRSPFGIDSAGLIQCAFKVFGIQLPRLAEDQATHGELVDFVDASKIGDLAFFESKSGKIDHVGLILEDRQILHASGTVRIDKIDHFGIYHYGKRSYTHVLRFIKRLV